MLAAHRLTKLAAAQVRIPVEWGFMRISTTFKTLQLKQGLRVLGSPVGLMYMCAAELCNAMTVIRGGNQISEYFGVLPPTVEEYVMCVWALTGCFTSLRSGGSGL